MKRLLTFLTVSAAMLVAGKSYAQISIRAGFAPETWTTTTTAGNSSTTSTSSLNGIFVGAHYNLNITGDLGVSLGVQYRYNFGKETGSADVLGIVGGTFETKKTQSVLDVPVLLNYGLDLSEGMRLSIFAGPTLNLALAGNSHTTTTVTVLGKPTVTESDNDWYGNNTNYESLNLSATFGINFTYMNFGIFGGYNMGLLDMNKLDNVSLKTAGFFVGLGYTL